MKKFNKTSKKKEKKMCDSFCKKYVKQEIKKFEKLIKTLIKTKTDKEEIKNLNISLQNFILTGKSLLDTCKSNCSVYNNTIVMK